MSFDRNTFDPQEDQSKDSITPVSNSEALSPASNNTVEQGSKPIVLEEPKPLVKAPEPVLFQPDAQTNTTDEATSG
jgi:hypothetical protein